MNASDYEQELAQTHGVTIRHWLKPLKLHAEAGKLTASISNTPVRRAAS